MKFNFAVASVFLFICSSPGVAPAQLDLSFVAVKFDRERDLLEITFDVAMPYTEEIEQSFTVQVPYSEQVDGKTVARYRDEVRTRTVSETRTRTERQTRVIQRKSVNFVFPSGKPVPAEVLADAFSKNKLVLNLPPSQNLTDLHRILLKPDQVIMTQTSPWPRQTD